MPSKLKSNPSETKLEKETRIIVNKHLSGYDENPLEGFVKDLQYGGCISGLIGELIYFHDTQKFFLKHRDEINTLLAERLSDCGCSGPGELFGEAWDTDDPLASETTNQNLLAWFGFEETAFDLIRQTGIEF